MTNLLALFLVAFSLSAACLSISPDQNVPAGVVSVAVKHVKERIKEAASVLPNLGQGLSYSSPVTHDHDHEPLSLSGARELICDAYGKCKHKIANAMRTAKSAVSDETADFQELAVSHLDDAAERAKQSAYEAVREGMVEHIVSNAIGEAEELVKEMADVINLVGLAAALGMSVWISFINSRLLGMAIPRHQFGVVQSKIYPVYFKAMAVSIGAALVAHMVGRRKRLFDSDESSQACNLMVSLMMVLFNAYVVEPRATKTMFDRMKIEKEEGRGRGSHETRRTAETQSPAIAHASEAQPVTDPAVTAATACASVPTPFPERAEDDRIRVLADGLNTKLKRFNSCSSLLNLITFFGLLWHLVYLSRHLRRC